MHAKLRDARLLTLLRAPLPPLIFLTSHRPQQEIAVLQRALQKLNTRQLVRRQRMMRGRERSTRCSERLRP